MHYAASYGRLPHIHPDFCDIEPLTEADFQDYDSAAEPADEGMKNDSKFYLVHFCELICRGPPLLSSLLLSAVISFL